MFIQILIIHEKKYAQSVFTYKQRVVSIGRLTAFYVILVPMEYIPSEPPHSAYVSVSFCT